MDKICAYGAPFPLEYSSCSNKKTKLFEWTGNSDTTDIVFYIDKQLWRVPITSPSKKNYGWLCESSEINDRAVASLKNRYQAYKTNLIAIFTCDESLINIDPIFFKYAPAGSNIPWIVNYEITNKTKLCSMLCSEKLITTGHKYRHEIAKKYMNKIDLFGGAHGSPKIGEGHSIPGYGPEKRFWRSKDSAIKDYMFSIVMENGKYNSYYTEKITDCFASGTIPVYWGCSDIGKFFNTDGIIILDDSFDINCLTPELYYSKIEAIKDNFERVKKLQIAEDYIYDRYIKK